MAKRNAVPQSLLAETEDEPHVVALCITKRSAVNDGHKTSDSEDVAKPQLLEMPIEIIQMIAGDLDHGHLGHFRGACRKIHLATHDMWHSNATYHLELNEIGLKTFEQDIKRPGMTRVRALKLASRMLDDFWIDGKCKRRWSEPENLYQALQDITPTDNVVKRFETAVQKLPQLSTIDTYTVMYRMRESPGPGKGGP